MNQVWQYWARALDVNTIAEIITAGESAPLGEAGLGFDGSTNNSDVRSSEIHWLNPNMDSHKSITDMLWYFAREANKNAFGFDIDYLPDIQYTKYTAEQNGHYDWHCDTFWANPTCYDRKISIVIQLSDPADYEGGDFQLDAQYPQLPVDEIRQRGTVIVFPSFLNHRVTPVTSGTRRSLVAWLQGPKFR